MEKEDGGGITMQDAKKALEWINDGMPDLVPDEAFNVMTTIRRALEQQTGWRPISEAPKTGEVLLYWHDEPNSDNVCTWTFFDEPDELPHGASHWMPLPPPPTIESGDLG